MVSLGRQFTEGAIEFIRKEAEELDSMAKRMNEYPKRCPEMDCDYGRSKAYMLSDNTIVYESVDRDRSIADEILRLKEEREFLVLREEVKQLREMAKAHGAAQYGAIKAQGSRLPR